MLVGYSNNRLNSSVIIVVKVFWQIEDPEDDQPNPEDDLLEHDLPQDDLIKEDLF